MGDIIKLVKKSKSRKFISAKFPILADSRKFSSSLRKFLPVAMRLKNAIMTKNTVFRFRTILLFRYWK